MKSLILAATVLLGAAALPAHHNIPAAGLTVSAFALQQEPSSAPAPASSEPAQPAASQPAPQPAPSPAPDVKVDVHTTSTSWHPNPTWVAIGVIGAVVLIVLIVMASRGESNTVIRG